jgi:GNAT superfamily N-acetyltransferase
MIELRAAASDDDLGAYVGIWSAITPDEPADAGEQRERRGRDPQRLYLLADLDGAPVGAGFAGRSDSPGRGFLSPRVLPEARRRGVGVTLLRELAAHLTGLGFGYVSSHVDGRDPGSLEFARRFGFEDVDRQVEQVRAIGDEPPAQPPPGVRFVTIAERPELLRAAHELALEGYADLATSSPVTVRLDDWLRDEATLPNGSFVALAGDEIVGYSGLCRRVENGTSAEDGLTVVRRAWRRRGLATALKRAELAWAAANGIVEIVTWTQRGNEGMRSLNETLGYALRSESITVRAPLPLDRI